MIQSCLLLDKNILPKDQQWSYIYHLIDPVTKEIRYVGKSKEPKKRYLGHIRKSKKITLKSTEKEKWINSLLQVNLKPKMIIVGVTILKYINRDEITEISKYPNLTNATFGSNGNNFITEKTRDKLKGRIPWNKGTKYTQHQKQVLSDAHEHQKIKVIDQYGTVYDSIAHASKVSGAQKTHIMGVIKGKYKSAKGYIFKKL